MNVTKPSVPGIMGHNLYELCLALDRRYQECDTEGHKDVQDDKCDYCHRRLKYETPRADGLKIARRMEDDLELGTKTRDQHYREFLQEEATREREIAPARREDYFNGLRVLNEELNHRRR